MANYIDKFKDVNEIKECAKYYIQLLGLQDWRIVYKHGVPSNEDWAGECESQFQEKCAKITIDNRTFDDMWFKQPQELTLIHELIHCKIPMMDNGHMEGNITEIFYHQLVDDWARSIFQVSIIGWDEDYVRKWECNTPTAKERLEFVKLLRSKGFWCSIRIQPIIDILQCEKLCYNIGSDVDYVTLEHFKLIYDIEQAKNAFMKLCDNKTDFEVAQHKLQMKRNIKIQNIKRLQTILNKNGVLVGVGDNDLHYMSQSRCCCGIDVARESFKNYLKYNLTYMATGEIDKDTFIPQCNPRKHINDQKYGLKIDCKQYVEDYISNHLDYCGGCKHNIEKQLFGISKTKLF